MMARKVLKQRTSALCKQTVRFVEEAPFGAFSFGYLFTLLSTALFVSTLRVSWASRSIRC